MRRALLLEAARHEVTLARCRARQVDKQMKMFRPASKKKDPQYTERESTKAAALPGATPVHYDGTLNVRGWMDGWMDAGTGCWDGWMH